MTPTALRRLGLVGGAALGFVAVATGAFGAHALKSRLDPGALATWELASRYALGHAPALLAAALLAERAPSRAVAVAVIGFLLGAAVFCGTLWLLALTGVRWLGAITPLGGTALLVGWLALGLAGWRAAREPAASPP